ncbi:MAG: hypothetical protein U1E27_04550, partial [Kiritimatiellia bacterium]|nr:hypothetical protein [Kiritimatiellia bacterium]
VNSEDRYTFRDTVIGVSGMRRGEGMTVRKSPEGEVLIERIRADLRIRIPEGVRSARWTPLRGDFSALCDSIPAPVEDGFAVVRIGEHPTIWYLLEMDLDAPL